MKGKILNRLIVLSVGLAGAVCAQDELVAPPPGGELNVEMRAEDITEPNADRQIVEVIFTGFPGVDPETIGDGDVWVVSTNGYNELAALAEIHQLNGGEPGVDPPANGIPFHPITQSRICYAVPPPSSDGWTREDNGDYAVLLQPNEVGILPSFGALATVPPQLLGYFRVRIGGNEFEPAFPELVEISVERLLGQRGGNLIAEPGYVVNVRLGYAGEGVEIVDWGTLRLDGNTLVAEVDARRPAGGSGPPTGEPGPDGGILPPRLTFFEHRYFVHDFLEPGDYRVLLRTAGKTIGSAGFTVPGEGEFEPAFPVEVNISIEEILPPIPALLPSIGAYVANVRLGYVGDDVEIVDWGTVRIEGEVLCVEVDARRPVGSADPIPGGPDGKLQPPPALSFFEHSYFFDGLAPGEYRFVLKTAGQVIGSESFIVRDNEPGPPPAIVELRVDPTTTGGAIIVAQVEFTEPGWFISNPGEARVVEGEIIIDARAERSIAVPVDPGPFLLTYEVRNLVIGQQYHVDYRINEETFARAIFIAGPGGGPVEPQIESIEIHEGNASHFATVNVVLPHPALEVLDWGEVRREGRRFFVEIVVGTPDGTPGDPNVGDNGLVGPDFPIRLVSHDYVLGVLERGEYAFIVTHLGKPIAVEEFFVQGHGGDTEPPEVRVEVDNILEPSERPHPFTILYHDSGGLDLDSIRGARVTVVAPDGQALEPELVSFINTEDFPPSQAIAEYSLPAPGGSWNFEDRGRYIILVDPDAIRDLSGNALEEGRIGRFDVRIWPEPPTPPRGTEIDVEQSASGAWHARVSIVIPAAFGSRDDWEIRWGELQHYGRAIVARARFVRAGSDEPIPAEEVLAHDDGGELHTLTHTYPIGPLGPGLRVFVFLSNVGHFGVEYFEVEGDDGGGDNGIDPRGIDVWHGAAFPPEAMAAAPEMAADNADPDKDNWVNLAEYFFGTNPMVAEVNERLSAEIVEDETGRHLGLRFKRAFTAEDVSWHIEASSDMRDWERVDDEDLMVVMREPGIDGLEENLVCLVETMAASGRRYLRLVITGGMP